MSKPTFDDIEELSTHEVIRKYYLHLEHKIDYTKPQLWVDDCMNNGFDPRNKCVWYYPPEGFMGEPLFLCQEWEDEYRRLTGGL